MIQKLSISDRKIYFLLKITESTDSQLIYWYLLTVNFWQFEFTDSQLPLWKIHYHWYFQLDSGSFGHLHVRNWENCKSIPWGENNPFFGLVLQTEPTKGLRNM